MTGREALQDIESELKYHSVITTDSENGKRIKIIKKELRAFEIIEKNNVNVYNFKRDIILISSFTYRYYINNFGNYHNGLEVDLLDEYEFDLLKEILEKQMRL